jgi:hypothetical protein
MTAYDEQELIAMLKSLDILDRALEQACKDPTRYISPLTFRERWNYDLVADAMTHMNARLRGALKIFLMPQPEAARRAS